MDTKLKNYRYSVWFKLFAIVLCVAGMLSLAYGLLKAPYFEDAVQNMDFKESMQIENMFNGAYQQVSELAFTYKNEEYIKSGGAVSKQYNIKGRKNELINDRENEIQEIKNRYDELINRYLSGEIDISSMTATSTESGKDYIQKRIDKLNVDKNNEIKQVDEKYDGLINNIEAEYIRYQLSEYHSKVDSLKRSTGICYTVLEADKVTCTNVDFLGNSPENFYKRGLSLSCKLTKDNVLTIPNSDNINHMYTSDIPSNAVIYIGLSQANYDKEQAAYNQHLKEGLLGIKMSSIGLLAFLVGLIYLIYAAGRRVDKEGIHLIFIDHAYLDVALVVSATAIVLFISQLYIFCRYLLTDKTYVNTNLLYIIFGIVISIGTLIGILFVTMLSKRVKRHELINQILVFKVCRWITHILIYKVYPWSVLKIKSIYYKLSSVFDKSPLAIRLVLIFAAYTVIITVLVFLTIGLIITGSFGVLFSLAALIAVNVVAIYYILKIFKAFKNIKEGAERIRAGEFSDNIPVEGILELRQLSETINGIADGLKTAVNSQVKAERMKAELITNVSHDLKTPLTSIITYVDLLKNEGLQSENADKYFSIIDSKSQRLKALTDDLFEAAKASSGNIVVNLERLDIVSLINQGLGELSDKIDASGLDFRIKLPSEKLYVNADGKLLWRVIENLLSNVFKYALPNSRVYINAFANAESVNIVVKNISAYELNINEDELMERFKRGDASRHSEGSGLGLSIAKSLTELQGGSFHIEIDGDLFKATIVLVGCE